MAALDTFRAQCTVLGTDFLIRATRGICHRSLQNADTGRATTHARLDDWTEVLTLYTPEPNPTPIQATA
jgi:hypothetical protein